MNGSELTRFVTGTCCFWTLAAQEVSDVFDGNCVIYDDGHNYYYFRKQPGTENIMTGTLGQFWKKEWTAAITRSIVLLLNSTLAPRSSNHVKIILIMGENAAVDVPWEIFQWLLVTAIHPYSRVPSALRSSVIFKSAASDVSLVD